MHHLWFVDPERRTVECLAHEAGELRHRVTAAGDDVLVHPDFDGLTVELAALWRPPQA